ncbi:MAG: efflux RND transporter permease subunit [Bryobacterales bacterium]|nr:efflux RND transporter permease subunit [Bryobacterales bacterium]
MIERIIQYSARRRGTVIGLVLALALWGAWNLTRIPIDALPDLSDTQVILYSRWDRGPDVIEDQVTYPIVTAMLGAPRVKAVRGVSDFGYSFVYVVFEDGTDLYWARSRAQEYLASALPGLPPGVRTELGPDATGLGWVFQYALTSPAGKVPLAELRTTQDFFLRYHLQSVPGVAEVASVGGFVPQFQVTADAARLRALGIPFSAVVEAVRRANVETGGRLMEFGGSEYMIRGRGYLRRPDDLAEAVVAGGPPSQIVRIRDVGSVTLGPEMRRGIADLDGLGEAVSGIVIMRQGANAVDVIDRVKEKLAQIAPGLPAGVKITPVYDRAELVHRVIGTLRSTLIEIIITVVLVILLFLWHPASALIPVVTIPLTLLAVAAPFHLLGLSFNVMSLGGIAIAVGALVDAAIVVVEQTHKKLEEWQDGGQRGSEDSVIVAAVREVGRPAFFALLVMAVAFLPVLTLEGQEGRLFHPLAYAKSLTMLAAALLAITLDPALRLTLAGLGRRDPRRRWGRWLNSAFGAHIHPEEQHPLSRVLMRIYQPVLLGALRHKGLVLAGVAIAALVTVPVYRRLGAEFIPPLDEGVLLYMPSTVSGISIDEAGRLLQLTSARLKSFPEVAAVLGKAGRASTSTDPAPLSMIETLVVLKPRREWPQPLSHDELIARFDAAMRFPGVANSWTMPVRGRIDMLATGIRTPLGLKITGGDLARIQQLGARVEDLLRGIPGTRSVFAERSNDGRYIDVDWDRAALARAGISMEEAQSAVQNAIGGDNVTTVIEGRARYPVNVRLPRDARGDLDALRQVLVGGAAGDPVPLGRLAQVRVVTGPSMIRDENALLTGYVYLDLDGHDPQAYIREASAALAKGLQLPAGYAVQWSGQYEAFERVNRRLLQVVPLTLALIAVLLYASTRSAFKTGLVLLAVPFSAIGAIWSLSILGYPLSPAVWVGLIALLGVDAETGVFMVLYLDLAWQKRAALGRALTPASLREAVLAGAVHRLRPKFMTVSTMFLGLVPILWATGAGSEVMKRIAAPMIGGLATSFLMELIVYPVLYERWQLRSLAAATEEAIPTLHAN